MFFLVKNTLRCTRCKNNQKYFNGDLVAMLNYRLSYECWAAFPHSCKHGFGQSPHHSLSAKQPRATKVLQCSSNFSKSFGVILTELSFLEQSLVHYCQRQCFDADAIGRCKSDTKQRVSKPTVSSTEHHAFDRREINAVNGSKNI